MVTFPCTRLKDSTVHQFPALKLDRCEVIPHVALASSLCPRGNGTRNAELTLCHAGSLTLERRGEGFLRLLRAMAKLFCQGNPRNRIRLRLAGIIDSSISQYVMDLGLTAQVEFLGKASYLDSLRYLSESDVQVVIESPYLGTLLQAKFVDYTQTRRPILAISPRNGTLNDILSKHGGGIATDCESDESVYQALSTLYDSWEQNRLQEMYGSERLYDLFDPERIVTQYASLYERISTQRESAQK